MLSPLTQIAITLLHDIAMHEPHEAIGHCTSPEELRYIYTRLEQKGMISVSYTHLTLPTSDLV